MNFKHGNFDALKRYKSTEVDRRTQTYAFLAPHIRHAMRLHFVKTVVNHAVQHALKHRNHSTIAIQLKYMELEDKVNELARDMEKSTLRTLMTNLDQLREALKLHEKGLQDVE